MAQLAEVAAAVEHLQLLAEAAVPVQEVAPLVSLREGEAAGGEGVHRVVGDALLGHRAAQHPHLRHGHHVAAPVAGGGAGRRADVEGEQLVRVEERVLARGHGDVVRAGVPVIAADPQLTLAQPHLSADTQWSHSSCQYLMMFKYFLIYLNH